MDSDTAKIYIKNSKIQGVLTWYPQKLLLNFQNQRYSPSAQDSQVNEKWVVQRVAENLDNCVWWRCALRCGKNISLRIIKSKVQDAAAATRPKMSYFRAGIHDYFFSNL